MSHYLPVRYETNDCLFVRCLGHEDNPPLAHWGPGYRKNCILHYVTKGSGYFNGKKVCENQGFFISDNQLQEYHPDSTNPWTYFWIIFSKEAAEKYIVPIIKYDDSQIFQFSYKEKLIKIFQNLFNKHTYLSHTQALSFFFQLISLHESTDNPSVCIPVQHVENAKSYIEFNVSQKISIKNVADNVHINERYLYNLFIKYEGISPKEYMNQQKTLIACELLTNSGSPISEIAYSVGFPDVCTFSKFFQKRKNISPTKYRESHNTHKQ